MKCGSWRETQLFRGGSELVYFPSAESPYPYMAISKYLAEKQLREAKVYLGSQFKYTVCHGGQSMATPGCRSVS